MMKKDNLYSSKIVILTNKKESFNALNIRLNNVKFTNEVESLKLDS